jgi:hypothetical protein
MPEASGANWLHDGLESVSEKGTEKAAMAPEAE